MTTFDKLVALLDEQQVRFRIIAHPAEGRTEVISGIRGNALAQAAKAMVLQVSGGAEKVLYVLAIVPGDCKVNFNGVAQTLGGKKSRFAPVDVAQELTHCVMGAVPPFSFNDQLRLLVDERIRHVETLFFNAGELDKSMAISVSDYFRVVGEGCTSDIATPVSANT